MTQNTHQIDAAVAGRTIQRLSRQLTAQAYALAEARGEEVDHSLQTQVAVESEQDAARLRNACALVTRRLAEVPDALGEALLHLLDASTAEAARLEARAARINVIAARADARV